MEFYTTAVRWLKANSLPQALFEEGVSVAQSRRLFSAFVEQVEIENHHYCNRRCPFCSNLDVARRDRPIRLTPEPVFSRIVEDLAAIDYGKEVVWARYSELLAHDSVYARMRYLRQRLPRAFLVAISNGDYLDRDRLERLAACGLDRLYVNLYAAPRRSAAPISPDQSPDRSPDPRMAKWLARIGLRATDEQRIGFQRLAGAPLDVLARAPRFIPGAEGFYDRGGLVDNGKRAGYRRRAICWDPLRAVTVDFNGQVVQCCQAQSLAPEHAGAIVGDLSQPDYSLFHAYRDLARFRRQTFAPGRKTGLCAACDYEADHPLIARRPWAAALLARLPGYGRWFENHMRAKRPDL